MLRLISIIFLGIGFTAGRLNAAQPELINGIAVIVDDAVITYEEVDNSMNEDRRLLYLQYRSQPEVLEQKIAQMRGDRLRLLVERRLILQEFKRRGFVIPESVFDRALTERIREDFGDRLRLAQTLQAQGTTYESFKQRDRERLIVGMMTREFVSLEKIVISPFKVEKYYTDHQDRFRLQDQVKLRMIVLERRAGVPPGEARRLADEILAKLKEGASFAEMASVYSTGTQRTQGGDYGWVERKVLREELAQVAFSLEPGRASEVVDRPEACYLMLVEEKKTAHVRPLTEVRDEIEATLRSEEYERLRQKWIESLRQKSFIRSF